MTGRNRRPGWPSCAGSGCCDDEDDDADVDEVVLALHRYLGRTPSRLLALSLADAVGEVRTQNQPGTTDEYPNWRVPLAGSDGGRCCSRTCSPTRARRRSARRCGPQ